MSKQKVGCVMRKRLQAATPTELNRLCQHLHLEKGADSKELLASERKLHGIILQIGFGAA